MTRFKQDIAGEYGEFWKKEAEKQVAKRLQEYEDGILIIDEYGVAYWSTNNNAVPQEVAEQVEYAGLPINMELTAQFRDEQTARSLEAYRKRMANHEYTEEELWEMRCAFGEGATVVDVITGKTIQL